ncbi:sugar nucleotide-binding protein [Bizionia sediminis]|uniref:dTDP-4-dehydrorhamnose reductase n=1 Tax=Bizionia sediminis TaxID=1737064 RepID=A0ABW5KRN8_9FLAO
MWATPIKHRILILGASGFIGNALYKELCPYYNTYGTYKTANTSYASNQHFYQYDVETDDVFEILNQVKPTFIISALRGNFHAQILAHTHLIQYVQANGCKLLFLSSANVFYSYSKYPSYETDKTFSQSIYGHFKIKIENMLLRLPKHQAIIVRLPMVFGQMSPRLQAIKTLLKDKEPIEVFPNLILNIGIDTKLTQQIHFIINQNKTGIFHLGSTDLVHHDAFIKDILQKLAQPKALIKNVFTTNNDRYLAVLPKYNLLPTHLQFESNDFLTKIEV